MPPILWEKERNEFKRMIYLTTLIDLSILLSTIVYLLYKRRYASYSYTFFFLLVLEVVYQLALFITSFYGFNNHFIANVYYLLHFTIILFLLKFISVNINGMFLKIHFIIFIMIILSITGWLIENFVIRDVFHLNVYTSGTVSLITSFLSIYILNQLLNIKTTNFFKDSDILLLIGIVFSCMASSVMIVFLNFDFHFSNKFYKSLINIFSIIAIVSDFIYFVAALCLPKKMKYTWPS